MGQALKDINNIIAIFAALAGLVAFFPATWDLKTIWLEQERDAALIIRFTSLIIITFQPLFVPQPWQNILFLVALLAAIISSYIRAKTQ